ncbi:MAG: hypothetical protein C9356_00595 [Oleiphilus sp.]|nr:MAG: hypothetical protein C9356_00595 [Oleiphilus sp.]
MITLTLLVSPPAIRLKPRWTALLLCCSLFSCLHTHAAIIYHDDFDRDNSSLVGQGWLETEKDQTDVAIYQNALRLRDYRDQAPDAAAVRTIDLTDFSNVALSFDWRATSNTEPSDTLFLGWKSPDLSFNTLWSASLGGSDYLTQTIALNSADSANGSALAFWIDVSSASETAYIDNVLITGDPLSVEPATEPVPESQNKVRAVPEPASSMLLISALAALLAGRKQQRQKIS